MPTNEERREVVARLREVKKTGLDFTWCKICMGVCGPNCPVGCDEDEMAVDVAKRLADLIEPEPERTCNVIFGSHELSKTQTALVKSCSGCGFEFGTEIKNTFPFEVTINSISIPNYCPNCGAKVVE